jgi:hypothetical protein
MPLTVHKLPENKPPLLVHTLHELAKKRSLVIPYGQLTRFAQNHEFDGDLFTNIPEPYEKHKNVCPNAEYFVRYK